MIWRTRPWPSSAATTSSSSRAAVSAHANNGDCQVIKMIKLDADRLTHCTQKKAELPSAWLKMINAITQRRKRILALIAEAEDEVSVANLVRRLGRVSAVTIRRDIAALAAEGWIDRTHGGAMPLPDGSRPAGLALSPKDASLQDEL